jgi:hypothetical protein
MKRESEEEYPISNKEHPVSKEREEREAGASRYI